MSDLLKLVLLVSVVAFTVGCGGSAAEEESAPPTQQEMEENAAVGTTS